MRYEKSKYFISLFMKIIILLLISLTERRIYFLSESKSIELISAIAAVVITVTIVITNERP